LQGSCCLTRVLHAQALALHRPPGSEPSASSSSLGSPAFSPIKQLYCLSDHGCPGTEKCCQSGPIRTCLLPTTESPGYCPRTGSKCCAHGCCTRCLPKPGLCPQKRVQRSAIACPNRCTDDRDCPGNRKCCFSGCGLACELPAEGCPAQR
uniref:WAP domain-containing protein n=1 Tax=Amazona collaria TaxID=241587 RepID=A0A8B9FRW3_9PSIT